MQEEAIKRNNMSNEEAQKILDSMHNVMPENLTGEAKKIFEAIMVIADGRDKAYKELEEKDKIIELMAKYIAKKEVLIDKNFNVLTTEAIKQYFKKQVT